MEFDMENHLLFEKMKDWHHKRTGSHIFRVKQLAEIIVNWDYELSELTAQVSDHDASKFREPEETAYIHISWMYKCKFDPELEDYVIPDSVDDAATTHHHVKNHKHHPEYWTDQSDVINRNDRDTKPSEIVDGTKMPDVSIAEMVCDWGSVAIERGSSLRQWADDNVGIRWYFGPHQTDLIYELIEVLIDNVDELQ
jgi:hypothetical protein